MTSLGPVPRESLLQRVVRQLDRFVAGLAPGTRLPTEQDLAERMSVSVRTIREAVGQLVARKVLDRRHGSGTYVCPRLPDAIALQVDMDLGHPGTSFFYLRVAAQCQALLVARGFDVRTYYAHVPPGALVSGEMPPELRRDARAGLIKGVVRIAETGRAGSAALEGLPVAGPSTGVTHRVRIDRTSAFDAAAEWLHSQGRRTVGVIHLTLDDAPDPDFDALLASLERRGLSVSTDRIVRCGHPAFETPPLPFDRLWTASRDPIDALIVTDDLVFRDALPSIMGRGIRIPGDLAVVAHSNRGSGIQAPFACALIEANPDNYAAALVELAVDALRGIHPTAIRTVSAEFRQPREDS